MPQDQILKTGEVGKVADGGKAEDLAPPAITHSELNKFFADNSTAVTNNYLNTVAHNAPDTPSASPTAVAQAAAEAAQATQQAVEAAEQPETFTPIAASPFGTPYNPGEFNIPLRFARFLDNVRASSLFSLPSSFFNSLPGGGSPVYEIEAGQYGHHTIDLSQTMSTGLAVLKTLLLACFGFLSIRVVILKR